MDMQTDVPMEIEVIKYGENTRIRTGNTVVKKEKL